MKVVKVKIWRPTTLLWGVAMIAPLVVIVYFDGIDRGVLGFLRAAAVAFTAIQTSRGLRLLASEDRRQERWRR